MITTRLSSGRWVLLDTATYAMRSHPFSWERQAMAATLAVEDAVLSGRAAAALHGIDGFRRGALEVTVPRRSKGRTRLARVRRSDHRQVTQIRNIPCLTVAHTVLSLAGCVTADELDVAVDDVLARRLVPLDELQDRFASWAPSRRPGVGLLRTILTSKGGGFVPPTSRLERVLRAFLSEPGLPPFEYEYELPWWPPGQGRVDAYAPSCSLVVEADGRAWHTRERELARDLHRDNLATANGHGTLRFTWIDLTRYPDENRDILRQTVAVREGVPVSVAGSTTAAVANEASDRG
jgi:hypothetical protein